MILFCLAGKVATQAHCYSSSAAISANTCNYNYATCCDGAAKASRQSKGYSKPITHANDYIPQKITAFQMFFIMMMIVRVRRAALFVVYDLEFIYFQPFV